MKSLYDACWDHWYRRAKARARKDPRYHEIERLRYDGEDFDKGFSTFLSEKKGLGWDEWHEQHEIFDRLSPRPWWVNVHHWRDKHRLRFGMRRADVRHYRQRGQRGFSDRDVWSFDTYLARVIAEGVEHLRTTNHGYPAELTEESWDDILTRMAAGFRAAERKFDVYGDAEEKALMAELDEGLALFSRWFTALWD